jgi:hypothetical protein
MINQIRPQDLSPTISIVCGEPSAYYEPFIALQSLQQGYNWSALHVFELEAAKQEIKNLGQLEPNWDGYGALKIQEQTQKNALVAAETIFTWVPIPDIAPNANGTISMEWESEFGIGHLEIGQTKYSFYMDRPIGGSVFYDGSADQIVPYLGTLIASGLFSTQNAANTATSI